MRARVLADLPEAEVFPVCIRDEIRAVALAAAYANQVLDGNIDKMELTGIVDGGGFGGNKKGPPKATDNCGKCYG